MGTTLTGTTPQDTYDSLIKVTDNGPLSGTLKALSDGLGNDSTLSLSTTAASIAGTLAVSGNATFDTNTLFVDAASNEVGIGTASPQSIFHIGAAAPANAGAKAYTGLAATAEGFLFDYYYDTTASNLRLFDVVPLGAATTGIGGSALRFLTVPQTTTNTPLERMRITSTGNVGIGTSAPPSKLSVFASNDTYGLQINTNVASAATTRLSIGAFGTAGSAGSGGSIAVGAVHNHSGSAQSAMTFYTHDGTNLNEVGRFLATGGLTFNGDTAAANALDDYEEGTFTPTLTGSVSNPTYTATAIGNYTKIGRQVVAQMDISIATYTAGSGIIIISLPFTVSAAMGYFQCSCYVAGVDISGLYLTAEPNAGNAFLTINQIQDDAAAVGLPQSAITAGDLIRITATYFV